MVVDGYQSGVKEVDVSQFDSYWVCKSLGVNEEVLTELFQRNNCKFYMTGKPILYHNKQDMHKDLYNSWIVMINITLPMAFCSGNDCRSHLYLYFSKHYLNCIFM